MLTNTLVCVPHPSTPLQEMYLKRKSFAFNSDRPGAGGEDGRDIFERALKTVDVTFQVSHCSGRIGARVCWVFHA
jgi:hypothetical protein